MIHGAAGDDCPDGLRQRWGDLGWAYFGIGWLLQGEPSEAACRALLEEVDASGHGEDVERTVLGQRALFLDDVRLAWDAPDPWAAYARAPLSDWLPPHLDSHDPAAARLGWRPFVRGNVEALTTLARRSRVPSPAAYRLACESETTSKEALAGLNDPVSRAADLVGVALSAEALTQVTRVALRLRIHRLRTGSYPETLQALATGPAGAVPRDPMNGEALRYVRTESGFELWSVGLNGKDDGGPAARRRSGAPGNDDLGVEVPR